VNHGDYCMCDGCRAERDLEEAREGSVQLRTSLARVTAELAETREALRELGSRRCETCIEPERITANSHGLVQYSMAVCRHANRAKMPCCSDYRARQAPDKGDEATKNETALDVFHAMTPLRKRANAAVMDQPLDVRCVADEANDALVIETRPAQGTPESIVAQPLTVKAHCLRCQAEICPPNIFPGQLCADCYHRPSKKKP
jgi:hypothetical protein